MTLSRMTPAEVDAFVGANLQRLREDAGLEVPHAAARLRIDPDRLAAAEAGVVRLTCPELLDATRCFGCGLAALFDAPPPPRIPS